MVKLVDTPDLGSGALRRVGSSPIRRTKNQGKFGISLDFFLKGTVLLKSIQTQFIKKRTRNVVQLYNFDYFCNIMRKIIAYKRYYADFMAKLSQPERIKIMRALLLFETEDKIPHHYIKYIRDGIYEFRVNYGNNEFRIFFIYDGDTIVVLFNCFKKKTQKTPDSEIKKAVQLKKEYYEQKE